MPGRDIACDWTVVSQGMWTADSAGANATLAQGMWSAHTPILSELYTSLDF